MSIHSGVVLDVASLAEQDLDLSGLMDSLEDWDVHPATSRAQTLDRIQGKQVAVTNKVVIDAEMMRACPELKLICITATGTNNVDLVAAKELGITVSNVVAYATDSVVQHVFAMMLSHFCSLPQYSDGVRSGDWSRSEQFCLLDYPVLELRGQVLGIIGYGELGRALAKVAEAFGMKVLIAEREGAGELREGRIWLDDLLLQADVISLHVPLADNTENLIDSRRLGLMKESALLINTARGAVVDNKALAEALRKGEIGGAALDVLDQEPPPEDHVLLAGDIPNLLLTPHSAWAGRGARQNVVNETLANIRAFIAGESRNRVA